MGTKLISTLMYLCVLIISVGWALFASVAFLMDRTHDPVRAIGITACVVVLALLSIAAIISNKKVR